MFDTLVLAGGGPLILGFLGGIEYLEHVNAMGGIRRFVGTSAGAMLAFLLCLGMTAEDIREFVCRDICEGGCNELDVEQALDLLSSWGLSDGSKVEDALRRAVTSRFHGLIKGSRGGSGNSASLDAGRDSRDSRDSPEHEEDDVSFGAFARATGRDLVVCVSNLSKQSHEFLSVDSAEKGIGVLKALRMSMAIPLIFTPVVHGGDVYVDGGLYNNFPIDYSPHRTTLGMDIATSETAPLDTFVAYLWRIILSTLERSHQARLQAVRAAGDDGPCVVTFQPPASVACRPMGFDADTFSFDVSPEHVSACMCDGYLRMRDALAGRVEDFRQPEEESQEDRT